MPQTRKEKQIENDIVQIIRMYGHYAEAVQSGSKVVSYKDKNGKTKYHKITFCSEGTPDILACIHGVFVGIEVKKSNEEVQKRLNSNQRRELMQKHHAKLINDSGGMYRIVSSVRQVKDHIDNIDTTLQSYK